jgi:hypothetical protein
LGEVLTTTHLKKLPCYETLTFSSDFDWSFGITQGTEKGHEMYVDLGVDGRIILKLIFRKWDGSMDSFIWLRKGTGGGLL